MRPEVCFVAITREDDSLAVMQFVVQGNGATPSGAEELNPGHWLRQPTEENIAAEVRRVIADAKSWRLISPMMLPTDRTFRDAWTDSGKAIDHDMGKARAICLGRLRVERNQKLDLLDKEWMKAAGQKQDIDADAVEARRQELRDFPAEIAATLEAARDIDTLKAIQLPE